MVKTSTKLPVVLWMLPVCLFLASRTIVAGTKPPAAGELLPTFELVTPEDPAAKSYLGLSESERFTITQIDARVVIIELFSMY